MKFTAPTNVHTDLRNTILKGLGDVQDTDGRVWFPLTITAHPATA